MLAQAAPSQARRTLVLAVQRYRPLSIREKLLMAVSLVAVLAVSPLLRHAVMHPLFVSSSEREGEAQQRVLAALAFIESSTLALFPQLTAPPPVEICVVVQAANRTEPYLLRTIASALDQEPGVPSMRMAIVGDDAMAGKASHILPVLSFQQMLEEAPLSLQYADRDADRARAKTKWHAKQRIHYALALVWCMRQAECPRCLVLENDALLARNALRRTVDAVRNLEDWGMVRLFKTHHFEGWARETWFGLFPWALAGAAFGKIVFDRPGLWSAWSVLIVYLLGRQHVLALSRGTGLVPTTDSVSSIAHVYPRQVLVSLIEAISYDRVHPIDVFIAKGGLSKGLSLWELRPNVVQHIGAKSSWTRSGERAGWWQGMPESISFDTNAVRF